MFVFNLFFGLESTKHYVEGQLRETFAYEKNYKTQPLVEGTGS
jgi:hypothetical protein